MKRKVIYYKWLVDYIWSDWGNKEVIWSIIWKDEERYLVETFNWLWNNQDEIKSVRIDYQNKPPRMKKKWTYVWIRDSNEDLFKHIWIQTR